MRKLSIPDTHYWPRASPIISQTRSVRMMPPIADVGIRFLLSGLQAGHAELASLGIILTPASVPLSLPENVRCFATHATSRLTWKISLMTSVQLDVLESNISRASSACMPIGQRGMMIITSRYFGEGRSKSHCLDTQFSTSTNCPV